MCLQSSWTGSELYALEFFFPPISEDDENIQTRLSLISRILHTVEEKSKTFKPACSQEFGGGLSIEVTDFPNGQRSRSAEMIEATRFFPTQLDQPDQPSMDAVNSRMNVVGDAGNYNLPGFEPLQNGKVVTQLDSPNQSSMDPANNGQDVFTAKRNILEVISSEESKRKTQKIEHSKIGVRIEVSFEDIRKCSKMSFSEAARKLQVGRSVLKHICRCYGIYCWPPRKIKMVRKIRRGYGIYRWLPREINMFRMINMFRKINMVCYSRPLPVEDQEQIPNLPSDLISDQASSCVGNIQDASMVIIKAKRESMATIKFRLPLSSKLEDLKQEVAKRLGNQEAGTYSIHYKDEEDELILMACDEDLQYCIRCARSVGYSTVVVLLVQGQPVTNLNPIE